MLWAAGLQAPRAAQLQSPATGAPGSAAQHSGVCLLQAGVQLEHVVSGVQVFSFHMLYQPLLTASLADRSSTTQKDHSFGSVAKALGQGLTFAHSMAFADFGSSLAPGPMFRALSLLQRVQPECDLKMLYEHSFEAVTRERKHSSFRRDLKYEVMDSKDPMTAVWKHSSFRRDLKYEVMDSKDPMTAVFEAMPPCSVLRNTGKSFKLLSPRTIGLMIPVIN
ncbi:hypothetical protein UY3_06677 [Chelonia mydas]|uniref:Uncharacterized protein n=1 Tax=Chelonia mydas TaxID=8469 RepID=M7BK98_CHEMY|nr:hypothetical protein UY3_06677 [Chelonia mydas]